MREMQPDGMIAIFVSISSLKMKKQKAERGMRQKKGATRRSLPGKRGPILKAEARLNDIAAVGLLSGIGADLLRIGGGVDAQKPEVQANPGGRVAAVKTGP